MEFHAKLPPELESDTSEVILYEISSVITYVMISEVSHSSFRSLVLACQVLYVSGTSGQTSKKHMQSEYDAIGRQHQENGNHLTEIVVYATCKRKRHGVMTEICSVKTYL